MGFDAFGDISFQILQINTPKKDNNTDFNYKLKVKLSFKNSKTH